MAVSPSALARFISCGACLWSSSSRSAARPVRCLLLGCPPTCVLCFVVRIQLVMLALCSLQSCCIMAVKSCSSIVILFGGYMVKDLLPVEVLVVKAALVYMRKSLVRARDNAVGDHVRGALGKDIEALDAVLLKC